MRPRQLSSFLAHTIKARLPVLITGAPGVGKSCIVEQAAEGSGADLILTHPVVSDPTDYKGLPFPTKDGESAKFLPFGDLKQALDATKPTVFFIDDLGQAPPSVQAALMQLLLARRINGHILPEFVTFIAATNRRTDRAGVSGLLEPVKSRFASIIELEPNLDDWCEWALSTTQPHELVAFMRFRPALLHAFNPTQDLKNSPCPRTWANAGRFVNMGLERDIELAAIQGAVGEGAAAEFVGFLQICRDLPPLDGILLDPQSSKIPCMNPAAMYAVATGLASKATKANYGRVYEYAKRLATHKCDAHKAGLNQFAVLLLRDVYKTKPETCDTSSFIEMMSSRLGEMIRG